jgi:hypothetical protein
MARDATSATPFLGGKKDLGIGGHALTYHIKMGRIDSIGQDNVAFVA